MATYTTNGKVWINGALLPHGASVELAPGPLRDQLARAGAIWRPNVSPFVYRDQGTLKLVPADGRFCNRPVYGQVFNGEYVSLMHRLGFPLTDDGRRAAAEKWSGLLMDPVFTMLWLEPPLPILDQSQWPASPEVCRHWVWVERSSFSGRNACEEFPDLPAY